MTESNIKNIRGEDNIELLIINKLKEFFGYFPTFLNNINIFIQKEKEINENYLKDFDENLNEFIQLYVNLKFPFYKNENWINQDSSYEKCLTPSNSSTNYDKFYSSESGSYKFELNQISEKNSKKRFIKSFLNIMQSKFNEFNLLLISENIMKYPFIYEENFGKIDFEIQFLQNMNNLYSNLNKKHEFSNNDQSKIIFDSSNINIIENDISISSDLNKITTTIKSFDELRDNLNNGNFIREIIIKYEKTDELKNLNLFNQLILSDLEKLDLTDNDIIDISALEKCILNHLSYINLQHNKIGNKVIEVFKKIKLPYLEYLNLFDNEITTIKVFDILDYLPSIKTFYIGNNSFNEEEIKSNQKTFTFPNLLEIGLSKNFNDNTIHFIKYLKMENLEKLFLNHNKLSSLKFLENIHFNSLKELWANFNKINNIKEINYINNKKNINTICLNGNNIEKIDNTILEILVSFPKLKTLSIPSNGIENHKYKEIIRKIENNGINLALMNKEKN